MSERHYSDEEVAEIFERASKVDQTGPTLPAQGKGVTLAALQEIGREVGISPESIALAAQSLEQGGQPAQRTLLGLPVGVGRSIEFDHPLSDAEWEALVSDLRTTFEARGVVRYDGPFRQWTNGNLQALVEPTRTGHRLRIQSMKSDGRAMIIGGTAVAGVGAAAAVFAAATGTLAGSGLEAGVIALLGAGMLTTGALQVSAWARRRKAQFEAIIARLTRGTGQP